MAKSPLISQRKERHWESAKILMKNAKSKTNEASDGQTEMKVNLNTLPILITVFKNSQRQGQAGESVQCDGLNNIILVARENVSPNHEAFKLEFKKPNRQQGDRRLGGESCGWGESLLTKRLAGEFRKEEKLWIFTVSDRKMAATNLIWIHQPNIFRTLQPGGGSRQSGGRRTGESGIRQSAFPYSVCAGSGRRMGVSGASHFVLLKFQILCVIALDAA